MAKRQNFGCARGVAYDHRHAPVDRRTRIEMRRITGRCRCEEGTVARQRGLPQVIRHTVRGRVASTRPHDVPVAVPLEVFACAACTLRSARKMTAACDEFTTVKGAVLLTLTNKEHCGRTLCRRAGRERRNVEFGDLRLRAVVAKTRGRAEVRAVDPRDVNRRFERSTLKGTGVLVLLRVTVVGCDRHREDLVARIRLGRRDTEPDTMEQLS